MARLQAFVLVTSLPADRQGMNFSPESYGFIQVVAGVVILWTSTWLYPRITERFGPKRTFVLALGWTVLLTLPFPLYCLAWQPAASFAAKYLPITAWQSLCCIGLACIFPSLDILLNRECDPEIRGAAFGVNVSLNAVSKSVFMCFAGYLVQAGCQLESSVPGGRYLVFYVTCLVGLCSMLAVKQLPSRDCA